MAYRKVDEEEYSTFLCKVESLIKLLDRKEISISEKDIIDEIQYYINEERETRELMKERNSYYKLYMDTKDTQPEFSKEIYELYIDSKNRLNRKKGEKVEKNIREIEKERDTYYNLYNEVKDKNPDFAREIYTLYKEKNDIVKRMKGEDK